MHASTFSGPISSFAMRPKVNVPSTKTTRRFIAMNNPNGNVQKVVVMQGSSKNVMVAFLLSFFFGPLGMFYSTVSGALIMLVISIVVGIFTLGFGLFITWPICIIWACVAAGNHNKKESAAFAKPCGGEIPL